MKSESGISYTKLLIIFSIIIIILVIIGSFINNMVEKEKFESLKTDMLKIQAKTQKVKGEANINSDDSILKGYKISQLPQEININEFLEKNIIQEEDKEKYYLLNQEDLNLMGLADIKIEQSAYYIVNYENGDVIYTKGYEMKNKEIYYKLVDIKNLEY